MSEILLSGLYDVTPPDTHGTETLFGRAFYATQVGFGKIEEVRLDDGYPATEVTFTDAACEPFISIGVEEVDSELSKEGDEAVIRAIALAIAHRNQVKLFS